MRVQGIQSRRHTDGSPWLRRVYGITWLWSGVLALLVSPSVVAWQSTGEIVGGETTDAVEELPGLADEQPLELYPASEALEKAAPSTDDAADVVTPAATPSPAATATPAASPTPANANPAIPAADASILAPPRSAERSAPKGTQQKPLPTFHQLSQELTRTSQETKRIGGLGRNRWS